MISTHEEKMLVDEIQLCSFIRQTSGSYLPHLFLCFGIGLKIPEWKLRRLQYIIEDSVHLAPRPSEHVQVLKLLTLGCVSQR